MIEPGSVIGGKYRLDRVLGEGGMGEVWAATHTLTNKGVAIKLLKADVANPETLRRFVREARAASAVRHPNVVEVHDVLTLEDGSPAMVMDLLEGETLAQLLDRDGPIPLADLAAIMAPVLSAVGSAHAAGIVHRDLKPDNIFLAQLGDGRTEPMVLDFGIAKLLPFGEELGGKALTESGVMMGTPFYMAPEQAFGERDVDARADIWSLGVILFECSSGRKPIEGETLGQVFKMITAGTLPALKHVAPHLPPAFIEMVEGMMKRDRDRRQASLREPFELLRSWSSASERGFGAAVSLPPSALASAAQGLGASAVPVTKGVAAPRRKTVTPLVIGGSIAAALGLSALLAVALRSSAQAVSTTAASSAAQATLSAAVSAVPYAPPATAAPPPSASVASTPSASASSAARKPPATSGKPNAGKRRLLPGGVDEAVPF